jgi:hypothetical protein
MGSFPEVSNEAFDCISCVAVEEQHNVSRQIPKQFSEKILKSACDASGKMTAFDYWSLAIGYW